MIDLVIHEMSNFTQPTKLTNNEQVSIGQAYMGLLLTHLGTILPDPTVGVELYLGKFTNAQASLLIQTANSAILAQMKSSYGITRIQLSDYTLLDDKIIIKVLIDDNLVEVTIV